MFRATLVILIFAATPSLAKAPVIHNFDDLAAVMMDPAHKEFPCAAGPDLKIQGVQHKTMVCVLGLHGEQPDAPEDQGS